MLMSRAFGAVIYRALCIECFSAFTRFLRVIAFGGLCFSLGGCVEGVDLPEFVSGIPVAERAVVGGGSLSRVGSDELLEASGNWNIVEQGRDMDPAKAHLRARENVNVMRRKTNKELSAHFQPDAKSGEDGKMRVLRLERDGVSLGGEAGGDYDVAESSVVKPFHTVAGSELLQKIRDMFGNDEVSGQKNNGVKVSKVVNASEDGAKGRGNNGRAIGVVIPKSKPFVERGVSAAGGDDYVRMIGGIIVPPVKPEICFVEDHTDHTAGVVKVRSGKHAGKTRLVIEISKPTQYKAAVDHVRNLLRVRIDNARWGLSVRGRFDESALLGEYIVSEPSDGSVLFEVNLLKQSRIIDTMLLRPNSSSHHRIVIDLKD